MGATQRLQLAAVGLGLVFAGAWVAAAPRAQSVDRTQNPNVANAGIAKSLAQEIGAVRGDAMTPDSTLFVIGRDPFRAIRRGRQLFQRKYTRLQGVRAPRGRRHG